MNNSELLTICCWCKWTLGTYEDSDYLAENFKGLKMERQALFMRIESWSNSVPSENPHIIVDCSLPCPSFACYGIYICFDVCCV
jgi:hypothetical protein